VLREAQLERSDVIAGLTSYGAMTTVGICMTAQRIAPDIRTGARIDHGEHEEFEEITDRLELIEIQVAERAPAAGKSLEAGSFPGPDMVLEPGVQYILAVQTDVTDEIVRILRG